jgi:DNA-binding NarL/FixJ family response regulator
MNDNKKKVVIVDDHPLFRECLAQLINAEPDLQVTGEAENTKDALQLVQNTSTDLAIVEITLKGLTELKLIKSLRRLFTHLPVLVLSRNEEALYAARVLRAGASGYITKRRGPSEILVAVRRVLAGEVYLSEQMTSGLLKRLTAVEVEIRSRSVDYLTDRELEVLDLIGRGLTTREIAETLQAGVGTIDTYRFKIEEKLNLRNIAELQRFAMSWVHDRE